MERNNGEHGDSTKPVNVGAISWMNQMAGRWRSVLFLIVYCCHTKPRCDCRKGNPVLDPIFYLPGDAGNKQVCNKPEAVRFEPADGAGLPPAA